MALEPVELQETLTSKDIEYTNASAVTVNSGEYATITLSKKNSSDSATGYTMTGISYVYTGNLRIALIAVQGIYSVIVCNYTASAQTINAKALSVKFKYIKI